MFPLRLLDEQPPGELDHFTTGALKDNNLLNKMESVAIAIVNRRCNKFLLGGGLHNTMNGVDNAVGKGKEVTGGQIRIFFSSQKYHNIPKARNAN